MLKVLSKASSYRNERKQTGALWQTHARRDPPGDRPGPGVHLLDEVNVARPSCGNDMSAPGLGQLHSKGADAPSPCMDQHALALVHSRSLQRLRANSPDALAQLSEHHIGS